MRLSPRLTAFTLGLLVAWFLGLGITSAHALPISFEFGGSMASISNPGPLYEALGKTTSTSGTSLFAVPATLSMQLQNSQRGLLASIAIQERYLTGKTGAGEEFSVMTISPMLRLEFWMFSVGVGYSPFAFSSFMFEKAAAVKSSMTLEAQALFPITPEIDFGLSVARQNFKTDYGSSPSSMQYGLFFRLNFNLTEAESDDRRRYKGWRYPLGVSKK